MRTGDWVRCEREAASVGTWRRYAGRVGRIVTHNRLAGEFGVRFTAGGRAEAWFLPTELRVIDRPANAPAILTHREEVSERPDLAPLAADGALPGI